MAIVSGYASLAEFKSYAFTDLEGTNASDDTMIEDLITSASRTIDTATGRTFFARTETRKYDTPARGLILWVDDDLLTITTLTNGDGTTIGSSDRVFLPANVDPKYAIELIGTSSIVWQQSTSTNTSTQAISVLGTWGYASSTPADIQLACLIIANDAYAKRHGQAGAASGGIVTADGVRILPSAIPVRATALLRSYKKRT